MWPVLVVVAAVDTEHMLEMATTDDQNPVEAVGADGAHPALGVGVRIRRLHRRPDHADTFAPEDLCRGARDALAERSLGDLDPGRLRTFLARPLTARGSVSAS